MPYVAEIRGGLYQANEKQIIWRPIVMGSSLKGRRVLFALHGRGGQATQPALYANWMKLIMTLTDNGYVVMGVDAGAQSLGAGTTDANRYKVTWNSDDNRNAMTAARNYLITQGLDSTAKIGFMDYSLGGAQGFDWMSVNPGLCAGCVSFAPATDHDYFVTNLNPTNQAGKAEIDLAYTTSAQRTGVSAGTLNQVGSSVTVTDTTAFPASGTFVLVPWTTQGLYIAGPQPIIVTYTSKDATHFLGCTIATGTVTCGAGTVYQGAALTGVYNTVKNQRSPLLIASNVVYDAAPITVYLAADDASVGRGATPSTNQITAFIDAVNAAGPGSAQFVSVAGGQRATTLTSVNEAKTLNNVGTTLNVVDATGITAPGNAVVETGAREPVVLALTGKAGNQLSGVTTLDGSSVPVTVGMPVYNSGLGGHTTIFQNLDVDSIFNKIKNFSW